MIPSFFSCLCDFFIYFGCRYSKQQITLDEYRTLAQESVKQVLKDSCYHLFGSITLHEEGCRR
jgi:hypothetical protein